MSLDKLADEARKAWEPAIQEAAAWLEAEFYPSHLDQETQRYVYENMTPADYLELSQFGPIFTDWLEKQQKLYGRRNNGNKGNSTAITETPSSL